MRIYSVIVVGAGPAGLQAARHLKGDVLVIERDAVIGSTVRCAEGISLAALQREQIPINPEWIQAEIHHINRISPFGNEFGRKRNDPYAFTLNKPKFLKSLAQDIIFPIKYNTKIVSVERVGECWHLFDQDDVLYKCHHLVAADGPNSSIGTEVFQYTYTNIAGIDYLINFDREIQNDTMEMYFGNNIAPHGYAWFFPYSKTSANIGILTKKPCNLRSFYNKFLDSTIREKYGNYTVGENKSGVLPISGFFSQVEKDNAYLVGDAGAFTDPIFEGGIGFGLFTGRMVADAINQGSPGRYQAAIDALSFTGKDLYDAQEWFYTLSDKDFDEFTQIMSTDQSIASLPEKFTNNNEFIHFIKTWKNAKEYLW